MSGGSFEEVSKSLDNLYILLYNHIMITKSGTHELTEWQKSAIDRIIKSNHMVTGGAYEIKSQEITGWVGSTVIVAIEYGLKNNQYFGQHCIIAAIGSKGAIHSETKIF